MHPVVATALVLSLSVLCLPAQVCRLSIAGLNRARRVMGPVHAECPGALPHTAPFGNWGVTSNFGGKQNSHQFQGWCHLTPACDNAGRCGTSCRDGWYEWNSCTDHDLFQPPNCTLYNAAECTEQASVTGINVHGTRLVELPAPCPSDSDGDGLRDQGGCRETGALSLGTNFLSLYELDPGGPDELVQTLYFPATPVAPACDVWGCAPAGSQWVGPAFYDSPASPPRVFAEMAMVVNWGAFVDAGGACRLSLAALRTVSGASFAGPSVAPESIVSAFGEGLAPITAAAETLPLPTSLGSAIVRVTDRMGARRFAPVFFVSPRQVNFQVPPGTATGAATVELFRGEVLRATGTVLVEAVAPALFTANADGRGVAAALVVRATSDAGQTVQPVFQCGATAASCVPVPIDIGAGRAALVLFGSGIRGRSTPAAVNVTIGGQPAEVAHAGAQSQFVGLDQVNVALPAALGGRGEVTVVVNVDNRASPAVTIQVR